jgi:acetate---CoA ligase (ADP-forming) subunit beta
VSWVAATDSAELAVEIARAFEPLRLSAEVAVEEDVFARVARTLLAGSSVMAASAKAPTVPELIAIESASRQTGARAVLAIVGSPAADFAVTDLAGDLGIVALDEVRPAASAVALLRSGATRPWRASLRGLGSIDRARLGRVCSGERQGGALHKTDGGLLAFSSDEGEPAPAGDARDLALAIAALHAADRIASQAPKVEGPIDDREVQHVLFGPPRALSDPASKQALAPYGIPFPEEELCSSPSRASAEAARLGFPVRIALASPDLRIWDHPDLAVDNVESAGHARDVYRQIMTLASGRAPAARLLGVTVSATKIPRALLRLVATPVDEAHVLSEIGFADPHGIAAGDYTTTTLPGSSVAIERALSRLAGSPLLFEGAPAQRRAIVAALHDLFLRVARFVVDRRTEVTRVEIDPVAVLPGGTVEVREVCVTVGDAFVRSLEMPA